MRSVDLQAFVDKFAEIDTGPRMLFVYAPLPPSLVASLAKTQKQVAAGGDTQDLDHITLVYIPDAGADRSPDKIDAILASLRKVTDAAKPIQAKVQGWGYFDGAMKDGESKTALVGLVDAPGLEDLHVALKKALKAKGVAPSSDHIYTAHFTFAYLKQGARVPSLPKLDGSFTISSVKVAADKVYTLALKGSVGADAAAAAKVASTALMRRMTFARRPGQIPGGSTYEFRMPFMGREWRPATIEGAMTDPNTFDVMHSQVHPDFRGMGLGRKLYGRVLREHPRMTSDGVVSGSAKKVYDRMAARPDEYRVTPSPNLRAEDTIVTTGSRGDPAYTVDRLHPVEKTAVVNSDDFNTMDMRGVSPPPTQEEALPTPPPPEDPLLRPDVVPDMLENIIKSRMALEPAKSIIPIPWDEMPASPSEQPLPPGLVTKLSYTLPGHKDLTQRAIDKIHQGEGPRFTEEQIARLISANQGTDTESLLGGMVAKKHQAFHHHAGQEAQAKQLIEDYYQRALKDKSTAGALDALGIALHTTQDEFAHARHGIPEGVPGLVQHAPFVPRFLGGGKAPDSLALHPGLAAQATDASHQLLERFLAEHGGLGAVENLPPQHFASLTPPTALRKALSEVTHGIKSTTPVKGLQAIRSKIPTELPRFMQRALPVAKRLLPAKLAYNLDGHAALTDRALDALTAEGIRITPAQRVRLIQANKEVDNENAKHLMISKKTSPFHFHKGEEEQSRKLIDDYYHRALNDNTTEGALDALGIALHTTQDEFSHAKHDVPAGVRGLITHIPLLPRFMGGRHSPDNMEKYPELADQATGASTDLLRRFMAERQGGLGEVGDRPLQHRAILEEPAPAPQPQLIPAPSLGKAAAMKTADLLPGGVGDDKPKKLFDPEEFAMGLKVEREHTSDPAKAKEITSDHLTDDKKYYTKLDDAGLAHELHE